MRTCERCKEPDDSVRSLPLCRYCASEPDCFLGTTLPNRMLAALTGFSSRAVRALAHLREAWCVADSSNASAVSGAIKVLMVGHSMRDHWRIAAHVLAHGLDDGRAGELLEAVGFSGRDVESILAERNSETWNDEIHDRRPA